MSLLSEVLLPNLFWHTLVESVLCSSSDTTYNGLHLLAPSRVNDCFVINVFKIVSFVALINYLLGSSSFESF